MVHQQRLALPSRLARSPLPLLAVAVLSSQAAAAVGVIAAPGFICALAFAALLALRARKWRVAAVIALSLGAHRQVAATVAPPRDPAHVVALAPGRVRLRARVSEASDGEASRKRVLLDAEQWKRSDDWEAIRGSILLTIAETERSWTPGARIEVDLRLKRPRNFGNPGEFDYEGFLARRAIYVVAFLLDDDGVDFLEQPEPGWVDVWRERVRSMFVDIDTPVREILGALILGEKAALPRSVRDQFAAAGVSHVLCISGLHIAIVAAGAFAAIRWLLARSRWLLLRTRVPLIAAALSLVPVWLYSALAQAGVATCRALTMLFFVVSATLLGRQRDLLVSLAAAALVVSAIWPASVLDASFQLSFVSVFALAVVMERYWPWWNAVEQARLLHLRGTRYRWFRWGAASLAVNASALVATAPLTAYHFNQISLIGVVANLVVVPVAAVAVVMGLTGALVVLLAENVARWIFLGAGFAASLCATMTATFAALPGSSVQVPTPTTFELLLAYALLASPLLFTGGTRRVVFGLVLLLILGDAAIAVRDRYFRTELRVTFLSVGQGDCTIIEFPGSEVMVVDAGGLHGMDTGERIVAPYLWSRKIAHVDYLIATHPDFDHYGGLEYLVEHFSPREFWQSGATSENASFNALVAAVSANGVTTNIARAGEQREIGGCTVRVVWPSQPLDGLSSNDTSIVLHVACGDSSILLPGDLQTLGESRLLVSGEDVTSEVLKVGHHGSRTSTSTPFLTAANPRAAVISAGYDNRFGFPDAGILRSLEQRDIAVYRTDRDGAVVLRATSSGDFDLRPTLRQSGFHGR